MAAVSGFMKRVPYFADLGEAEIESVAARVVERGFSKGEVIFLEGRPCEGVYLVVSGQVRIYKVSPEGREQVLLVAGPGETFNEVPVFDGGPNPATAEALEPAVLYLLPRDDLLALAAAYPAIGQGIMRVFASHLRHLTSLVEDLSFRNVRSRVAKALLKWEDGQASGRETPRLTHKQIAALAGTAREVVGRVVKSLEDQGALTIEHGHIVRVDREKLIDVM
ncbi:MAG: Crp/Fnr family transcriptional regulator [Dehalococcoidia bacterium]|nr:Crp/Fnr family transcriptional regulator [Dehalococcoidia bacterium]